MPRADGFVVRLKLLPGGAPLQRQRSCCHDLLLVPQLKVFAADGSLSAAPLEAMTPKRSFHEATNAVAPSCCRRVASASRSMPLRVYSRSTSAESPPSGLNSWPTSPCAANACRVP